MKPEEDTYCHYSDLPSPMAYMQTEESIEDSQKVEDKSQSEKKQTTDSQRDE